MREITVKGMTGLGRMQTLSSSGYRWPEQFLRTTSQVDDAPVDLGQKGKRGRCQNVRLDTRK